MNEIIFCGENGCQNAVRTKGLCATHYGRERRGSEPRTRQDGPYPECSVSHCTLLANSRKQGALCNPHYQKSYRGIDPEGYVIPEDHPARTAPPCAEPGCQRTATTRGLCSYHRLRGQIGKTEVKIPTRPECKFEGCSNVSETAKLCHSHYEQLRTVGELSPLREYGKYVKGELRCPIPNCRNPQQTKGLCGNHLRLTQTYKVSPTRLAEIWTDPRCENPGCTNTTRLHMDHDHETGEFRGLLCGGCNSALGHIKEDIDRLLGLVEYKRKHS